MRIDLVKALDSDVDFLVKLRKLTMAELLHRAGITLSEEENRFRVLWYYHNTYLIQKSGHSVGMIKYLETNESIEIIQFQILPFFQHQRIGTSVITRICSLANLKRKMIKLKVLKNNPAKSLYEQLGFKIVDSDIHELRMIYRA